MFNSSNIPLRSARLRRRTTLIVMSLVPLIAQGGCRTMDHGLYMLSRPPATQFVNVDFPAMDVPIADHAMLPQPGPVWVVSPIDGWIHGFRIVLTDASGDTVPSTLLHHVKVMDPNRRELFNPVMLRLVGAGSETRSGGVPRSLGVPIAKGDSLVATAMIHNPTETGFADVRLRVQLEMTPREPSSRQPRDVYPFFLHVASAAGPSDYDLPPGRSERSWETSPAIAGEIVGFGGHIHKYGAELRFEEVETGAVLWRAPVERDPEGNVVAIPRKIYGTRSGPSIQPDRVYRLTAVYENPTNETIIGGGMGTMAGVLNPKSKWPEVDRQDPLYILDRARETAMTTAHPAHHH